MPASLEELDLSLLEMTNEAVVQCLRALHPRSGLQKLDLSGNDNLIVEVVKECKLPKLKWVNVHDTAVEKCDQTQQVRNVTFHFDPLYKDER